MGNAGNWLVKVKELPERWCIPLASSWHIWWATLLENPNLCTMRCHECRIWHSWWHTSLKSQMIINTWKFDISGSVGWNSGPILAKCLKKSASNNTSCDPMDGVRDYNVTYKTKRNNTNKLPAPNNWLECPVYTKVLWFAWKFCQNTSYLLYEPLPCNKEQQTM